MFDLFCLFFFFSSRRRHTRSRSGLSSEYREDLAWIHHTGFTEFAESAASWLRTILPRGLIVDVGCGSGVLARELTRDGFDVLGIDPSPSMLALARSTAPQ